MVNVRNQIPVFTRETLQAIRNILGGESVSQLEFRRPMGTDHRR
jgi:hypothetical protein